MLATFFVIILFSLLVSTLTSIWIWKKKRNKWLGLWVSLMINILILSLATIVLYQVDVQTFHKQTQGFFGSLGILVLGFFMPINTLISFYILEIVKNK
jgi:amino acid transporter